ncbi:hypothetical protein [Halocatena marina]|nr:hypothetical protein [Halocatena marina]
MQALGGTVVELSGTYYVRVKGTNITEYDLTVETQRPDQYDPNEQPATATSIESGKTISAVVSGSDQDTYAVDLDKGETISVMTSDVGSNLVNTRLLGPNASGAYFIHVYPYEDGIGLYDMDDRYELSITISGADDDEPSNEDDSEIDDGPTETPDEKESTDSFTRRVLTCIHLRPRDTQILIRIRSYLDSDNQF